MSNKPFEASFSAPVIRVRIYFTHLTALRESDMYVVGLNFGVQVAWIIVSWCTLVLFQLIMRRRAIRAHDAAIVPAVAESLSDKQGP